MGAAVPLTPLIPRSVSAPQQKRKLRIYISNTFTPAKEEGEGGERVASWELRVEGKLLEDVRIQQGWGRSSGPSGSRRDGVVVVGGALVHNNPRWMRRCWEHWSIRIQEGWSDGGRRSWSIRSIQEG